MDHRGLDLQSSGCEKNEIEELIRTTEERIHSIRHSLLSKLPVERYIRLLDDVKEFSGYRDTTPEIATACAEIIGCAGQSGLECYHQLVLLHLIRDFECRDARNRYPDSVREEFQRQFKRIMADFRKKGGIYRFESDSFCKDLGICGQRLIPCGVQLLDAMSGIPRSWTGRVGLRQLPRLVRSIWELGGFRPLYQFHTDRRQLQEFSPEGWRRCYGFMAALLRANPEVRGVFCTTWWYDPAVAEVSPHLRYLREVPESAGAQFFCMGGSENNTANALANSRERRLKFQEGTYRPKQYAIIWARRHLLNKASVEGWG